MFGSSLKRIWLALFIITLLTGEAFAQNLNASPMIFDVRRSLPLEPDEEVYKDFYINAGPEAGFKKGQYLSVVRLLPVHDPVQMKQQATLTVSVAKLLVIQTERNITVARLQSELSDEERPTLEYESVMIGDRIDVSQTTTEAPSKKKKKKTALVEPPKVDVPVVVVPVAAPAPAPEVAVAVVDTGKTEPAAQSAGAAVVKIPVPAK